MSGTTNFKLAGLDSNPFIYHFESNPEFAPYTSRIFGRLLEGRLKAVTSIVSLIETLSYPLPLRIVKEIIEGFWTIPNLEIVSVDKDIVIEAARIRREYKFRLPDSVQLATAKLAKAKVFISNDRRLERFKELKVLMLSEIK